MRGNATLHTRAGARNPPVNEATARQFTVPAPYAGWNARGNIANMSPLEAITVDNIFPGVQDVMLRKGSESWSIGYAADIQTLHSYDSATSSKLFASTNSGIYDATSAGTVGAAVAACTDGQWESVNYATTGGSFLTMVNGVDNAKLYDGTTWETVTAVSAHAITGVLTTSLIHVTVHKKRLWFVEKDSMNLWYLPSDSVAGAATRFPVGGIFRHGGKLVATATWTMDSGNGIDDYFVIATSKGELAVYQGTDPASSTTWSLVGVYFVGSPVGRKPFTKYGGDLLFLCDNGLYPLSKLMQSAVVDRTQAISFKIDGALQAAVTDYRDNVGWQMLVFPLGNFLLVNIPTGDSNTIQQFVMNLTTKAWCRFRDWAAVAWTLHGEELFFATARSVVKAWTGASDAGAPIQAIAIQAYSTLGYSGQKHVGLIRPVFLLQGNASIRYALDTDFFAIGDASMVMYTGATEALWDSALWDISTWDSVGEKSSPHWRTVSNLPGYMHSFRMQVTATDATWTWTATSFSYKPGGVL